MLSKRTTLTSITPLPPGVSREVVIDFLHNFGGMIDLNPLVKERHPIRPPSHAPADERDCVWYSITDKIKYIPGGIAEGDVTYTCAFQKLSNGIQTHCYAPAGVDLREKWTLNGTLPGERPEPQELGIGAPATGLYLREDVDMRCNVLMTSFVKKTLVKAHGKLVDQLRARAQAATATRQQLSRKATFNAISPVATSPSPSMSSGGSSGRTSGLTTLAEGLSPAPSACSSTLSSHASVQQARSQSYFSQDKPAALTITQVPPPVPPKIPVDCPSQPSDRQWPASQPYLLPQASTNIYSHTIKPQTLLLQMQNPPQPRRSSITTTPLSATDLRLVPDPLKVRPRSSDKGGNGRAYPHPDYPVMNPYATDLVKSSVGIVRSPGETKRGIYTLPAGRQAVRQEVVLSASLTGPFVAELE
ncbi:hypothetical protein GQ53DRAFT_521046 [Thozetella sp. PMI_491]|nr:hypothetical protein GQ53DRAFT_521046 [Thozetella sp. PMI_491]